MNLIQDKTQAEFYYIVIAKKKLSTWYNLNKGDYINNCGFKMSDTIIASIITGIIALIVGFLGGKTYSSHKKLKISQKAGKNSTQTQIGAINNVDKKDHSSKSR